MTEERRSDGLISVTVNDGKYTIQQTVQGRWECLRYGEAWPAYSVVGPDNLHVALAYEVASLREQITYWRRGTKVIIKCLEEARKADPMEAPIPFVGIEAKRWHAFRAEAFRHSLEMMGIPSCFDQILEAAA